MTRGAAQPDSDLRGQLELTACKVDLSARAVWRGSERVGLTTKEADLLAYFAAHANAKVSQAELLEHVWGYSVSVSTRTVYSTVQRLRAKIESDSTQPDHILSVYGVGYEFVLEETDTDDSVDELESRLIELRATEVRRSNLAAPLSPLMGRDREVLELREQLANGIRLLGVVGPVGVGKSLLLLQVAWWEFSAERYPGGVWYIDATSAQSVEALAHSVGAIIGANVPESVDPQEVVCSALRRRDASLLVLDNCEHLQEATLTMVHAWLQECEGLQVLVGSQHTVGLMAASVLRLEPMESRRAIQMFRNALPQAVREQWSTDDIGVVIDTLDKLPLTIELAAARAAVWGVDRMKHGLSERVLRLKSVGEHRAGQLTLGDSIEWSWGLLQPEEESALLQMAVFVDGFTVDAAEEVVVLPEESNTQDVSELLDALYRKSMISFGACDPGAATRFRLLNIVREYALARKSTGLDMEALHRRHAGWVVAMGERLVSGLSQAEQPSCADELLLEIANVRKAIRWTEQSNSPLAVRAGLVLDHILEVFGTSKERRENSDRILALAQAFDDPILLATAQMIWLRASSGSVVSWEEHHGDLRELDARLGPGEMRMAFRLCWAQWLGRLRKPELALPILNHSLEESRAKGVIAMEGRILLHRSTVQMHCEGAVASLMDAEASRTCFALSGRVVDEIRAMRAISLAKSKLKGGSGTEPRRLLEQALEKAKQLNHPLLTASLETALGGISQNLSSLTYYESALASSRWMGHGKGEAKALDGLSLYHLSINDPVKAIGYARQLMALRSVMREDYVEFRSSFLMAVSEFFNGQRDVMKRWLDKAHTHGVRLTDPGGLGQILILTGMWLMTERRWDEAVIEFERALAILDGRTSVLWGLCNSLIAICEMANGETSSDRTHAVALNGFLEQQGSERLTGYLRYLREQGWTREHEVLDPPRESGRDLLTHMVYHLARQMSQRVTTRSD